MNLYKETIHTETHVCVKETRKKICRLDMEDVIQSELFVCICIKRLVYVVDFKKTLYILPRSAYHAGTYILWDTQM